MTELIENDDRMAAQWRLDRFVRQFGPGYEELVQVAAVPIVLTPELVGYLRGQFLPRLSWVAEADLLLSELCRSVGYERYVMDAGVQTVALQALDARSPEQVSEISRLLVGYMQHLVRTNPYLTDRQRKHQQWAAMLCVAELRGEAIGQIAAELAHWEGATVDAENFGAGRSEMAFLDQVLREQRSRLVENSEYLRLATRVSQVLGRMNPPIENITFIIRGGGIIRGTVQSVIEGFPPLQTFEFETVAIDELEPEEEAPVLEWRNKRFGYDTVTLTIEEKKGRFPTNEIVITKGKGQAVGFVEQIDSRASLNMIAIPGGTFEMGAPMEELESSPSERPQHFVTVPEFWMGQCLVTQAQWKAVTGLPKVNLDLDKNPSRFEGAYRPVEQVLWDEAVEFCDRLSIATGRTYRLPSEAQWEYACRAGTMTPFHFGETIDAKLANYRAQDNKECEWSGKYGKGRLGEYRERTTSVGTFSANPFVLYDMHGNVWEWCEDDWHENYEGAPTDGSVWDASNDFRSDPDSDPRKVLRGGSWFNNPRWCRSASRSDNVSGTRNGCCGFRVVVVPSLPP